MILIIEGVLCLFDSCVEPLVVRVHAHVSNCISSRIVLLLLWS